MAKYSLWTSTKPFERIFDTAQEAISKAAEDIYVSPRQWLEMESLLNDGRAARMSYGFSGVEITIKHGGNA